MATRISTRSIFISQEQLTKSKHRQRKSNRVVLVCRKEKHTIAQPSPDEDVGDDPADEMGRVERHRANPIQCDKVPH